MMAAYYPNLSSQRDNLQSPYPGDQKFSLYAELPSQGSNVPIYMNQASVAGSYSEFLSKSSLSSHDCAEFPSVEARNEMIFIPPTSDTMNLQSINEHLNTAGGTPVGNPANGDSQPVSRTQIGFLNGEQSFQCQGLSLSLGTEMQSAVSLPSFQYENSNLILPSLPSSNLPVLGRWSLSCEGDENNQGKVFKDPECLSTFAAAHQNPVKSEVSNNPQCFDSHKDVHTDAFTYDALGYANSIMNSKYLKAAQHLLDEVVNVRKGLKQPQASPKETNGKPGNQSIPPISNGMSSGHCESVTNSSSEMSPAERQDLQNKKTKLLSMLDEVDRRYRQYDHQMQFVVSSFDMVAGQGAAKSYTALALQTISRHFRCLRDAINNQIEIMSRRLGEEYPSSNAIPRLRFVDQQLRQQRVLQQLGVMRHAWRPQRGLPESSVSVLRAWLFEHFLHPYPNDSEKVMLAKQTGLTRNQVANWFINARVRLWKPMVEDIYKEEFGDLEANSRSSQDDASKACGENHLASESRLDEFHESATSAAPLEMDKPILKTALLNCSDEDKVTAEPGIMRFQHTHNNFSDKNIAHDQHGDESLLPTSFQYDISAVSGFGIGNQVTLALGLQRHEIDAFSMSGGNNIGGNNITASSIGPDTADYHCMDPGKQQDRFGNSHLLHDFVV